MSLLAVTSACKFYPDSVALREVSFEVNTSQTLVITGSNGAGKSTLLRCLAGLERLDSGSLCVEKLRISLVAESSFLYNDLTLAENFSLYAASCRGRAASICNELVAAFNLEDYLQKSVRTCSRGVVQKASIVRALLSEPQLLLFDEPFSNLDSLGKEALCKLLQSKRQNGAVVILALHEPELISLFGERVLKLEKGRLVADSASSQLINALGKN